MSKTIYAYPGYKKTIEVEHPPLPGKWLKWKGIIEEKPIHEPNPFYSAHYLSWPIVAEFDLCLKLKRVTRQTPAGEPICSIKLDEAAVNNLADKAVTILEEHLLKK